VYYPRELSGNDKENVVKENLAIQLYGKRIYEGQTVGEYLLEFLLVFLGTNNGEGGFNLNHNASEQVAYITNPNIGLKRFIFFENSKNENRHSIDKNASEEINRLIMDHLDSEKFTDNQILYQIKDLFYGFNLITKQRSWFAQAMMPLCEDLVFCEAQNNNKRKAKDYTYLKNGQINKNVDKGFEFTKHSFLGRGGEVYYMHLLQGLQEMDDREKAEALKTEIENGIRNLLGSFPQFDLLSKYIQDVWEDHLSKNMEMTEKDSEDDWVRKSHRREMKCDWIKSNYVNVSHYSISEIRNVLKTSINQLEKLELLNIGIILQVFRLMITEAFTQSTGNLESKPIWVIQVPSIDKVDSKVKMMAVKYYSTIENYMTNALFNKLEERKLVLNENDMLRDDEIKLLKGSYKNSHKLLRKIGKDIGLIIPISGQNMRFTFSDDIMKYLVLSMIEPGASITLDSFLEKIYEYYGIVVREEEYVNHYKHSYEEEVYAPFLSKNLEEFIIQLRNNGYLKELSDATAIVTNPYDREVE